MLETTDLSKTFGALIANDEISLTVQKGDIHGIIGPNGSGKSTFFNCVSGFYDLDGGTVQFDGEDVTDLPPHERAQKGLCRTFQIPHPFSGLSVRKNLLAIHSPRSIRVPQEKRERAEDVMELLDIDHLANHEAGGLSGGQQNLLEIARVLMLEPDCVLLDEPTAGVNPALQNRILKYLKTMNDRGTTFVIVEHDMKVIEDITDRVSVFNQGEVITTGNFAEVKDDPRVREAYLSGSTDTVEELMT
jgi:ABC-type branched-subunit amino acid transport system ATPase component